MYRSVIAFRYSVFHVRNLTCAGKTVNTQIADRHLIVDPVPVFLRHLAGFRTNCCQLRSDYKYDEWAASATKILLLLPRLAEKLPY